MFIYRRGTQSKTLSWEAPKEGGVGEAGPGEKRDDLLWDISGGEGDGVGASIWWMLEVEN